MRLTPTAEQMLARDIKQIEAKLSTKQDLEALHLEIDAKYQRFFPDWGKGMYGYNQDFGFSYELISAEHNLIMMLNKLKSLQAHPFVVEYELPNIATNITPVFNNTVGVEIDIEIVFNETRRSIEDMTSMTESEIQTVLSKINELEDIVKSKDRKTKKWENANGIIKWIADKSVDIGTALLPLLLQIK